MRVRVTGTIIVNAIITDTFMVTFGVGIIEITFVKIAATETVTVIFKEIALVMAPDIVTVTITVTDVAKVTVMVTAVVTVDNGDCSGYTAS